MDKSVFLSRVIGIYFLVVSLTMLFNMSYFIDQINKLVTDAPVMFVTGFFTVILGTLMVVGHNVWEKSWRVVITIIGWLSFIKGISILIYPEFSTYLVLNLSENVTLAYVAASVDLFLGILLCYVGYKRY